MYTQTKDERNLRDDLIATLVLPTLEDALHDAAEILVRECEGFHPDVAYEARIAVATEEIARELTLTLASRTLQPA